MTGRSMGGKPSARDPRVPAPVARFAAMLSKAELVELLWYSYTAFQTELTPGDVSSQSRLAGLVLMANGARKAIDPMCASLDASRMSGPGVAELRRAIAEALAAEYEA